MVQSLQIQFLTSYVGNALTTLQECISKTLSNSNNIVAIYSAIVQIPKKTKLPYGRKSQSAQIQLYYIVQNGFGAYEVPFAWW